MNNPDWNPPDHWPQITAIEAHTAGEPLRVITGGIPSLPGDTILAKRRYFQENLDHLRRALMWEPRGHADMYGALPVEPVTDDGDLGVLFLHNEGFSSMCGHGIIALTTVALDTGMIEKDGDNPVLRIDSPAGRIRATAHRRDGRIDSVSFTNVPSYVHFTNRSVEVPGLGTIEYQVAFGGAYYAFVDAGPLGLGLESSDAARLIDTGRRIKTAVAAAEEIRHPEEPDLGFLYGVIFTGPPTDPAHHSRNVCIFADGELDRSPTGTGVSARAAIHHQDGTLEPGRTITIESILGTTFEVQVTETLEFGGLPAVVPEVTGSAYITGQSRFCINPDDPLGEGFFIR
jgi:proline racemase